MPDDYFLPPQSGSSGEGGSGNELRDTILMLIFRQENLRDRVLVLEKHHNPEMIKDLGIRIDNLESKIDSDNARKESTAIALKNAEAEIIRKKIRRRDIVFGIIGVILAVASLVSNFL